MSSETQNSTGSVRSSDKIEEQDNLTRMKVNEEKNMEQSSPYPDRPGERDCQFFLRTGECGYGNSCRFNHPLIHLPQAVLYHKDELPERIGEPDCEYYLKTGACKYGSTCKYHHPKDRNGAEPVLFNVLGYPMRQGEKSCPYYIQTGTCRFGVACKFHHPHPQPHNGHSTTYGMPSFPYGMMSLPPPATYGVMPPPQVPHPQAYMPFMFAPPEGWSPYIPGSNPIYNAKTQPDSSSERAECRFFMNTGTCKYGDDCKYSHPKERMLQSPPNLSHHIVLLPARPGQPACGNFKAYGFCKYGPNCKYDHPMPLNPYNDTGLTVPSLPTASPVSTHPRRSPPPPSSSDSNGEKPAAENHSSKVEEQDKSEVQESSQLSHSDSTAISNGNKSAAESNNSEIEKQEEDISDKSELQDSSQLSRSELTVISNGENPAAESHSSKIEEQDKCEVQKLSQLGHSDSTAISNGNKPAAESNDSSEIGEQEDISDKSQVQRTNSSHLSRSEKQDKQDEDISDKSELQESSQLVHSDPTALSNGKTDAEIPSSETKKQEDNASQPDN